MAHYSQRDLKERLKIEVPIYDRIAFDKLKKLDQYIAAMMGGAGDLKKVRLHAETFPIPINIWVDSVGAADTQFLAYRHISPATDKDILQLGGSGSHAVKLLLAGARSATLLSPSRGEVSFARTLAHYFDVTDRFVALKGVGEEIPISDCTFDGVYGGGCLHHMSITHSLPEVYRVLRSQGRAAFVEPIETDLYNFWVDRMHGTRLLHANEGKIEDRPFSLEMVRQRTKNLFSDVRIIESGGLVRYGLVALQRSLPTFNLSPQVSYNMLTRERNVLNTIHLQGWFGNAAILLTK